MIKKQLFALITAAIVSNAFAAGIDSAPSCNGWVFSAKAFFGSTAQFCWLSDDSAILGFETQTLLWIPYVSAYAPDTPCHGNFSFTILGSSYQLVGTAFTNDLNLSWYLARLRANEGTGWFYCSNIVDNGVRVFYYNGSYYDVKTDGNGNIAKVPQRKPQKELIQYGASDEIEGCETSGCCWLQDNYYDVLVENYTGIREFAYLHNLWYVWNGDASVYDLYTGPVTPVMANCFKRFVTNIFWTSRGTSFLAQNGTIYLVTVTKLNTTYTNLLPGVNYNQIITTSLADPLSNGTFYLSIEGALFSFDAQEKLQFVSIDSGKLAYSPVSTTAPTDPNWTASGHGPVPSVCNLQTCSGVAFYSAVTTAFLCLSQDDFLLFCDPNQGLFIPFANQPVPKTICWGNYYFKIATTSYWLNWTSVLRAEPGGGWTVASRDSFSFSWYLSRLRPNEGSGRFYCSYGDGPTFYFSGTAYFDVRTDEVGYIERTSQAASQYSLAYFFLEQNEPACQNPVCCWFTDYYVTTKGNIIKTEYWYNGAQWLVWLSNTWNLYTGEFNSGILSCSKYFSNMKWSNGTGDSLVRFRFVNGSVYQEPIITDENSTSAAVKFEPGNFLSTDPLAAGGFYYATPFPNGSSFTTGLYQNVSGVWWCQIRNGQFFYRKLPPNCGYNSDASVITWPCYATSDTMALTRNDRTVCDPSSLINTCGTGYTCEFFSEILAVPGICAMGFCLPDYKTLCPVKLTTTPRATTTTSLFADDSNETTTAWATTPAPMAIPQPYGTLCNYDSDCLTGICTGKKCSCTSCTKLLPYIDYSWRNDQFIYDERCIPKSSSIGGLGDNCDFWADVPTNYCAFGLYCSKCPETWNAIYANSTCNGVAAVSSEFACPPEFTCGYQATCTMIDELTPVCLCTPGYHLEDNLRDCYGWNTTDIGSCSVTCGNGRRALTRNCDRAPGSSAICTPIDQTVVYEPCSPTNAPCPLENAVAVHAVQLKYKSKVLTVDLFDRLLENGVKISLAKSFSSLCAKSKDIYEGQCCPGRSWPDVAKNKPNDNSNTTNQTSEITLVPAAGYCIPPSGITFYSKFADAKLLQFTFYMTVSNDPTLPCCTSASLKGSRRKKRATSATLFDQAVLATVTAQPDIILPMTDVIRTVDPNAIALNLVTLPTTSTTTTPVYDPGVRASSSQGLPMWLVGVAGGVVVFVVVVGIIVAVIIVNKIKATQAKKSKTQNEFLMRQNNTMSVQQANIPAGTAGNYPPKMQQYRSVYEQQGARQRGTAILPAQQFRN